MIRKLAGLLFGLIAGLQFVNHNFDQMMSVEGPRLIAAGCVVSLLIFAFSFLFMRDAVRSSLLTALTTLLFFNFVGLQRYFTGSPFSFLLLISVCVVGLGFAIQRSSVRSVNALTGIAGVAAVALLAIHGFFLARDLSENSGIAVTVDNVDLREAEDQAWAGPEPDIYYIMPDDYVGNIALQETYGFDNRAFADDLRELGYYVPARSFSNYPITTTSLASSINGGLLRTTGDVTGVTARAPVYDLIRKPEVARFLQKRGYDFIQMGSWWAPTQTNSYADVDLQYAYRAWLFGRAFHVSETAAVFIGKTVLAPILARGLSFGTTRIFGWEGKEVARIFLKQVEDLKELSDDEGRPRFVFAHLLMPHLPIVFDADGEPIPTGLPEKEAYLRQLQFTNKKLTETARAIENSDRGRTAVVILASDEGQFPANDTVTASDQELRHKSNTFAAVRFPDHDYSDVSPDITPVNYFRVVFNKYFGTHLAMQPDAVFAYRVSRNHPLDLQDVTGRVRNSFNKP